MIELKVIDLGNIRECLKKAKPVYYEYYAKSEADKVIAHANYKRCLAMVRWCGFWTRYWERCEPSDCGMFIAKAKFFKRWRKRWQKLADKFKEDGK